ncbi:SUR7/PalI family-domain-containing protein [Cercophora scortea]|uniref:SUR7/PalI family-domain-containing protein n=1 Tax=Cercophora scortea TaxID=314031 RepID=A0AAE0J5I1_9PEZI|nr:SUR7/PalI family-domain-containing protein [Cercophora scortea]
MLRPATPLSILLFAAFALLLLAVLSTPIIKAVPLGSFKGYTFGVFGYCRADGTCSPFEIGYDSRFKLDDASDFDLSISTRTTLSAILVLHPVAAFLTLAMFVLAVIAHFHSPSHSARYLLAMFIVGLIDFLVCLLCFLVDVLLFVPHMAWGSWIVLAATILVALSGLVSCAMRRTVVGRKARKKRIAANAEMSGENYYNRVNQQSAAVSTVAASEPTVPMISGANGAPDQLPEFATFEKKDDQSSDERIPLTQRSPSDRTPNTYGNDPTAVDSGSSMAVSRDQYGNPVRAPDAYSTRSRSSLERLNSRGRGNMPPGGYRGRGGYGPPGRGGGYNGYSAGPPPNGRGGYGAPARGGYYGPTQRGPPPPSYRGSPGPNDGRPPPGAYGRPPVPVYNQELDDLPRAESPPPLPELDDARAPPQSYGQGQYGIRDSDADVAGMLAMQQARVSTYRTEGGNYGQEEPAYVPPRQAWDQAPAIGPPTSPSPLSAAGRVPSRGSPGPAPAPSAGGYYEDVDPRFAEPSPAQRAEAPAILPSNSYEDIPRGAARSPAESDRSTFTSISMRGVNPRWNPNNPAPGNFGGGNPMPGNYGGGNVVPRRPVQQQRPPPPPDVLGSNPDFQLPARTPPRSGY